MVHVKTKLKQFLEMNLKMVNEIHSFKFIEN
jgi:hypothetical protein